LPPNFVPNSGQLSAAWLSDVEFRYNADFEFKDGVAYDLDVQPSTSVGPDGSKAVVHLTILWEVPEEMERPFDLQIAVSGHFDWEEGIDDEYKEGWTQFNGVYLLWPYLRAYVTSITAQSIGEPLVLPTLAVPRPGPHLTPTAADHEFGFAAEEGQH
jgi:preprotein translocase subunit SecB